MDKNQKADLTNFNEALHDILVNKGIIADDHYKIVVSTDGSRVHVDKTSPRTEVYITDEKETEPKTNNR